MEKDLAASLSELTSAVRAPLYVGDKGGSRVPFADCVGTTLEKHHSCYFHLFDSVCSGPHIDECCGCHHC